MRLKTLDFIVMTIVIFSQIGSVLVFMLSMHGCSSNEPRIIDSIFYDSRPALKMIIVERPPWRITYLGAVTKESTKLANDIMNTAKQGDFKNYDFNTNRSISISTANTLSDTQIDKACFNKKMKTKNSKKK